MLLVVNIPSTFGSLNLGKAANASGMPKKDAKDRRLRDASGG